jgi:hypothetical protein
MKKVTIPIILTIVFLSGCTLVTPPQYSTPAISVTTPTSTPLSVQSEQPKIISFIASPPNIAQGQSVLLTWQTENATLITIEPGIGSVSAFGNKEIVPASTTKYSIIAWSENGTASASQEVIVNYASTKLTPTPTPQKPSAPVIDYFSVNPSHVMAGSAITLTWSIKNATQITIDNDADDIKYTSAKQNDDVVAHPVIDTVYRIIAKNAAGSAQATVIITIDPSFSSGGEDNPTPCG